MKKLIAILAMLCLAVSAQAATYYVSTAGDNSNGTSWATAWDELDQISWGSIAAGDTIYIDGGAVSMEYNTTLTLSGVQGTSSNWIKIYRSTEASHDGTAYFAGDGKNDPLPYVGGSYSGWGPSSTDYGINFGSDAAYIEVDGREWSGITIYGMRARAGIAWSDDASSSSNIIVRNMRIYDCGYPDSNEGKGIKLGGGANTILFERMIVSDCMQDAVQGRACSNITWRRCWLMNSRPMATNMTEVWNAGRHHDCIQIFAGGVFNDWIFEDCIIGPNYNQGIFPTETNGTYVVNMEVTNCLFLGNPSGSECHPFMDKTNYGGDKSWVFTNCTFYTPWNDNNGTIGYLDGFGHEFIGCIFYHGNLQADGWPVYTDCMSYDGSGYYIMGVVGDPQFSDTAFDGNGDDANSWPDPLDRTGDDADWCAWDFTPANATCGYGDGSDPTMGVDSTMVTVTTFLTGVGATNVPPSCMITAPLHRDVILFGTDVSATVSATDSDGTIVGVSFWLDGAVVYTDTSSPYAYTYSGLSLGSHVIGAVAEDNAGADRTVSITIEVADIASGLEWEAETATWFSPFLTSTGLVYQTQHNIGNLNGGKLVVYFETQDASTTDYIVRCYVRAENTGSNSFYVDIDATPDTTEDVWDIDPLTVGIEQRVVSHTGTGAIGSPEFDPKVWSLDAGTHYIVFYGREGNTALDNIEVYRLGYEPPPPPPPLPPPPPADGPEAEVRGNDYIIEDADTTPRWEDYTDFGDVLVGFGVTVTHTFYLYNHGDENLTVTGNVTVVGENASNFTITQQPNSPVIPDSSTTFKVQFVPSTYGTREATVALVCNDEDEGTYTFAIEGRGVSDPDTDQDGLTNSEEEVLGTNYQNPDTDADGLLDGSEVNTYGTDPLDPDSDSDGMPDGWEVSYNLDPLVSSDAGGDPDNDNYSNLQEYTNGTNPLIAEGVGVEDIVLDVIESYDTSCMMGTGGDPVAFFFVGFVLGVLVLLKRRGL